MAEITLAEQFAPYKDPGVRGQDPIANDDRRTTAPDTVAPGTPPAGGHAGVAGNPGERAASTYDRDEFRQLELDSRHPVAEPTP